MFTCLCGKQKTESLSITEKSTSSRLSDKSFFAHWVSVYGRLRYCSVWLFCVMNKTSVCVSQDVSASRSREVLKDCILYLPVHVDSALSWFPWLSKYWVDLIDLLMNICFLSDKYLEYLVSAPGRWCPHLIVSNSTGLCYQPSGIVCKNWPEERCPRTQVSFWNDFAAFIEWCFIWSFLHLFCFLLSGLNMKTLAN